ncbi:hypothetical protein L1987_80518 [Smallanthus sonchifolius]|uniref:Uncharacterized protein n=1 Tax=Smallanthus sonchifolius TaxID=185202 RepID=A0ACB8YPG3_9ASTR|nr:hypothetical protein L1987_80518 [Smallanthus sonchifolius]
MYKSGTQWNDGNMNYLQCGRQGNYLRFRSIALGAAASHHLMKLTKSSDDNLTYKRVTEERFKLYCVNMNALSYF